MEPLHRQIEILMGLLGELHDAKIDIKTKDSSIKSLEAKVSDRDLTICNFQKHIARENERIDRERAFADATANLLTELLKISSMTRKWKTEIRYAIDSYNNTVKHF